MEKAELLYQLQSLEIRIEEVKRDIFSLQQESERGKKVKELKNKIEEKKKFLQDKQKEQRSINIDLQENLDKQKSHKNKISQISNPKELTRLEKEVEYLKEKQTKIEDKILEIMEEIENKNAELKEEEKILLAEEENLKKEKDEREENLKILQEELQIKSQDVEKLLKAIDKKSLGIYENFKKEKERIAVAEIIGDACAGCSLVLTTAQLSRVKNSEELKFCEMCGRILYYKKEVS